MNSPAVPVGGGTGMKFKNLFRPNTRKINPSITLATCAVIVNALGFEDVTVGCLRTPAVKCAIFFYFNFYTKLIYEAGNKKV